MRPPAQTTIPTDKNLGPATTETSLYFKRSLDNHLLNKKQYAEILAEEAFEYDKCNYRHMGILRNKPFRHIP
jgi:hypothetical protein